MLVKIHVGIIFFLIASSLCTAQENVAPVDTLFSIKWGTGQEYGREFFPQNVFGLPDTSAREDVPAVDPKQVVSLGENGEIIIGWKNSTIVNGEGNDFYVFENCFLWGENKLFAEPGIVSVSFDGINFRQFPFDPLTLKGLAGTRPTYGSGSMINGDFGGDGFDLNDIGVDSIRFIKIKDTTTLVKSDAKHPFYNPVATGFDLDAVVGVHFKNIGIINSVHESLSPDYHVQVSTDMILFTKTSTKEYTLKLYNVSGKLVRCFIVPQQVNYAQFSPELETGAFIVLVEGGEIPSTFKFFFY